MRQGVGFSLGGEGTPRDSSSRGVFSFALKMGTLGFDPYIACEDIMDKPGRIQSVATGAVRLPLNRQVHLLLDEPLLFGLVKAAKEDGLTVSALIRMFCQRGLKERFEHRGRVSR